MCGNWYISNSLDLNTVIPPTGSNNPWIKTYCLNLWAEAVGQATFSNLPTNYNKEQQAWFISFSIGSLSTVQLLIGKETKIYTRVYSDNSWGSWKQ